MSQERQSLASRLRRMAGVRLLVAGDFMVDRTIYGEAGRISPEAPTPVIQVREVREQPGGAGNVLRNIDSLGGLVWCAAVVGPDEAGERLEKQLQALNGARSFRVIREDGRKTTLKTRVVAVQGARPGAKDAWNGHHQIVRLDEETVHPISAASVRQVLSFAAEAMNSVQGVVISDYAKGGLPKALLQGLIGAARQAGLPIFVDPKDRDWSRYAGATVLTPNSVEAEAALEIRFSSVGQGASEPAEPTITAWEQAVQERLSDWGLQALLVTRGARGLSLIERDKFQHIPTRAREVFDVTGAGDTMLAAFALAVCAGADFAEAAQVGNLAAAAAVSKAGAAVVYPHELERELDARHRTIETKLRSLDELTALAESLRREGKKIVFTNGCFDLLHVGHTHLLGAARKLGDVLIVALNSDASVKRLKGAGRPLVADKDRAEALAALESVDYLVIFDQPDPLQLLQSIRPDVLVKGSDYSESEVVGADLLKSYGGEVRLVPLREGFSTTRLVEKIRSGK